MIIQSSPSTLYIVILFGLFVFVTVSTGQRVTFYEHRNKEGLSLRVSNIIGCTPLPPTWHFRVTSLDSHDHCLVVYDTPKCVGNFLRVKAREWEPGVIPNLKPLGFNDIIKSVKPCEIKRVLPSGRYRIQNADDKLYLTAKYLQTAGWTKIITQEWRGRYSQQWDVEQNRDGTYFLIPRVHLTKNPLTYNMRDYDRDEVTSSEVGMFRDREYWDIRHYKGNAFTVRNDDSRKCLEMGSDGTISQEPCDEKLKSQHWVFKLLES